VQLPNVFQFNYKFVFVYPNLLQVQTYFKLDVNQNLKKKNPRP